MGTLPKYKSVMLIFLILSLTGFSIESFANSVQSSDLLPYGRYLTLKMQPGAEQTDMLAVVIQVHFSPAIQTVGDAINEVLRYSGYALIEKSQQSPDLQNTLKKPLPLVYRDLGPVTLRQALKLLAGTPFELSVDLLNRSINFKLKPAFKIINN